MKTYKKISVFNRDTQEIDGTYFNACIIDATSWDNYDLHEYVNQTIAAKRFNAEIEINGEKIRGIFLPYPSIFVITNNELKHY